MNEDIKRLVEALRSKEHRQPINPSATYRSRDVSLFEDAARAIEELSAARSEPRPSPEGLAAIIEPIARQWIYRTAHKGPDHLCAGIAKEAATAVLAAFTAKAEGRTNKAKDHG